jgi:hypothetical protein
LRRLTLAAILLATVSANVVLLQRSLSSFSSISGNGVNSWSAYIPPPTTLTLAQTVFKTSGSTTGTLSGFAASETITYRLDAATPMTGSPAAATGAGTATITSLTIPAMTDGTHTVWAIGGSGSQASTTITMDTTAPANAITMNVVSGNAYKNGNTIYYRGTALGSFTLTNAVTDALTGPKSSATAALGGTTTGWTHTPSTVTTPAAGPYVSNAFSWTAATTSSPTESVTGSDNATNTVATGLTFTNDSAVPTGGSVDATGLTGTGSRYRTSTSVSVAFTAPTDALSGLAASGRQLYRATATLTGGTCGAYGAAILLATDPTSPYADTVTDGACFQYSYKVPDQVNNIATITSGDVKVDTDAPSAPTFVASAMTNTYLNTGTSTIYYRSNATSGSITLTGSATDAESSIASYSYAALGAGWTSTVGSLGVNTYSWSSASPAAPGAKTVTATNNAGLVSATSSLTYTADTAAPTGAALSYTNGLSPDGLPTITLTAPTDALSGVDAASGVLQRKVAPFNTHSTCGSYSASWSTVATNPGTSYQDNTVSNGYCYIYQYVVYDNVDNTATASSASVLKLDYYSVVKADTSLVSYWRLGDTSYGYDTFTGTAGTLLTAHTSDDGATWLNNGATVPVLTPSGKLRKQGSSGMDVYNTKTPPSADYSVEVQIYVASTAGTFYPGVSGRLNQAAGNSYYAQFDQTTGSWQLWKKLSGSGTLLSTSASTTTPVAGATYTLRLQMQGTTITVFVNGSQVIQTTDGSVTAAGYGGIFNWGGGTNTDTTGLQLDNYAMISRATDSEGTNVGWYVNGPTLGVTGALSGNDGDDAMTLSYSGYVEVPDAGSLDLGDTLSIEFWMKRGNAAAGLQTLADKGSGAYKVALNSSKLTLYKSTGAGAGTLIAQSTGTITDTNWHHVVVVKNGTGTAYIYLDGVEVGSGSGSGKVLGNTSSVLTFGSNAAGEAFVGSLDEIALYNTPMSATTAAGHYTLGTA